MDTLATWQALLLGVTVGSYMSTKVCFTCKTEKSASEFGAYKRERDGLNGNCKDCCRARDRKYYYEDLNHNRFRARENRRDQREREGSEVSLAKRRKWYNDNLERARAYGHNAANEPMRKARDIVQRAVASGLLERSDICDNCGLKAFVIEAHHVDYSKPLEVQWLCKECHVLLHVMVRAI